MNTRPPLFLRSATEVVDAFGGPTNFARWWWGSAFKRAYVQRAVAWKERGFPAKVQPQMSSRLYVEKGIAVPLEAFNVVTLQAAE
jgi:hypothetical protein